jgi:hypothetical protein
LPDDAVLFLVAASLLPADFAPDLLVAAIFITPLIVILIDLDGVQTAKSKTSSKLRFGKARADWMKIISTRISAA